MTLYNVPEISDREGSALWPVYSTADDLKRIEEISLPLRGVPATSYHALRRAAVLWPERCAVTVMPDAVHWQDTSSRTYGELFADVNRAANLLRSLGVERGDAVALLAPNCDELLTAVLAAEAAGIAAPINAALAPEQILALLALSGAEVLVCAGPELDSRVFDLALAIAAKAGIATVLALHPTGIVSREGVDRQAGGITYLTDRAAVFSAEEFSGDLPLSTDLAALFHTGGTTGAPKLAAHTHANQMVDAWAVAADPMLDERATIFAGLPLFHVNALIVTLLAPLLRGQTVLWAGPAGYREPALYACFWKVVEHFRVAGMSAVPTTYGTLAQCPINADISSLKVAMVGAAALPDGVRSAFEGVTGVPLVEGYGLTEATCVSVRAFPDQARPGAIGQRLPYQRIKAVRLLDDGTSVDLPVGDVGVLAVSGPTVFAGYVVAREEHGYVLDGLGRLRNGWLETGDLGVVDADGFVFLKGRAKDLIIRGGHNIDPRVVEEALLSHPAVTGAIAVGRPNVHSGEVPVAYVTVTRGSTVDDHQLVEWARERVTEASATPKNVFIIDELPTTPIGKPYALALRADAAERECAEALSAVGGIARVRGELHDGVVVIVVDTEAGADHDAITRILSQYALKFSVTHTETAVRL